MIAPTVAVSKHALGRYLERVRGVDPASASPALVEEATREIVSITGIAAALGATVKVHDGFPFIIQDYTVTTVLPKGGRPAPRSLPAKARYAVKRGSARA